VSTRELRLALAMRGGVSLAVWIGGAICEVDLVRRAKPQDPEAGDFWSQVLREATQYRAVVVDVLTGASAGGLNGVLYAASQVYDFDFAKMRGVWLDVGSTQSLVRKKPPWPSLFQGDEYFLQQLYENLRAFVGPDVASAKPTDSSSNRQRVELALSATVIEPVERPLPSPEEIPLVERRYAAGFRFRHPEEPWLPTDFPARGQPGNDDTLWRLAIAGRATSSYPGAFEAAEVRSTRRATFDALRAGTGTRAEVDLDGTFLDRTTCDRPFVVADGGILDNIPIQTALDFIANAPAAGPTERFLVYLQPGASTTAAALPAPAASKPPPDPRRAEEDRRARRSTLAVGRGVLGARVAGETINADIAALEAYNESIMRAETLRRATFQALEDRLKLDTAAAAARAQYLLTRASLEARQTFGLLLDPVGAMGEDQFPRRVGGTPVSDERWRSPIAGWSQRQREELENCLNAALTDLLRNEQVSLFSRTGDIGPLLRVTDLLIAWTRWMEHLAQDAGASTAVPSAVKGSLYRVRAFLGSILDRTRRLAWVSVTARIEGEPPEDFATLALSALRRLTDMEPNDVRETIRALRLDEQRPLEEACRTALLRIDPAVLDSASPPDPANCSGAPPPVDRDLLEALAGLLVKLAARLKGRAPSNAPEGQTFEPAELLHRVLGGPEPVTIQTLESLEVLCLPEFVSGRPGRRRIDFRRLSTANRTPLAREFKGLITAAKGTGLWWDPKETDPDRQQGIHVTLKLAGNELANFSAFLLAHWRANDWLWGRLDAVPTMVDLLVQPKDLRARLTGCTPDEALERIHKLVVPPGHPPGLPLESLVWARCALEVDTALRALLDPLSETDPERAITPIRTALIARRQWEILGEEQTRLTDPRGTAPGEPPTLEQWVKEYTVGAEKIHGNVGHAEELIDRFQEIAEAATEVGLFNTTEVRSPGPDGKPLLSHPPKLVGTALRRAGPRLGRQMAERLVKPSSGGTKWRTTAGIAIAALVVLGALGWFSDRKAFLMGLVFSLLPLGLLTLVMYRRLRALVKYEPPRATSPKADALQGDGDGI